MAPMSPGALNLVHSSSPSNTATSSSCGFHHCSLREQDVILRHRILPVLFCLAAQNNPVVIDLRYSFGSTLESNHNKYITNSILSRVMAFKDFSFCIQHRHNQNKVIKFDMFTGNHFHYIK